MIATAFATEPLERLLPVNTLPNLKVLEELYNKYVGRVDRARHRNAPAHTVEYYLKAAQSLGVFIRL